MNCSGCANCSYPSAQPIRDAEGRKIHEQANSEFHGIIIDASRNRRLREMYESLNAHLKIARIHASEESWRKRLDDEQAEHEQIVITLENQDVDQLVVTLRKHIYRAKDALVAFLHSSG